MDRRRRQFRTAWHGAVALLLVSASLAATSHARASSVSDPTATVPGTEFIRSVACVTVTECVVLAANDSVPFNGDVSTVLSVGAGGTTGNPIELRGHGFTEATGLACRSDSYCVVVGDEGGLSQNATGVAAVVNPLDPTFPFRERVRLQAGLPGGVTCIPSGPCVIATTGGLYVGQPSAWTLAAMPGLDPQGVACADLVSCLVLTTSSQIVPYDVASGTFGTPVSWSGTLGGPTGTIACASGECIAAEVRASGNGSVVVSLDPHTGAILHESTLNDVRVSAAACVSASSCLVVGAVSEGSYPDGRDVPAAVPVVDGVAGSPRSFPGAEYSTTLGGLACTLSARCLAVGGSTLTEGPGNFSVGLVLALTADGAARPWSLDPSIGQEAASTGALLAYNPYAKDHHYEACSATVVESPREDLILTAAHCVEDIGTGRPYRNIYFAPGFSGADTCPDFTTPPDNSTTCGDVTVGVWNAQWSDVTVWPGPGGPSGEQRYDWAFVRVHPRAGELPVQRVVGGLRLDINPNRTEPWTIDGYPLFPTTSTNVLFVSCKATSRPADGIYVAGDKGPLGMVASPCLRMHGGASGGPWIAADGRIGAVNKGSGGASVVGTYLGPAVATAYRSAEALK